MTGYAEPTAEYSASGPYLALMELTNRPPITFTRGRGGWLWDSGGNPVGCESACNVDRGVEWAPVAGQFQAADLTGLRGCSSSKRLGLR